MPVIQVNDTPFSLKPGQTRLGTGPDADIAVAGSGVAGVVAVLDLGADERVVIRRAAADAAVRVNGVSLGAEPTPLMHGDKLEIGGVELRFSDDTKGGATQYVSANEIAAMAAAKRAGPARATAATGGRLVSLVDGKEYTIADSGLVLGREAGCDVVVAQTEVSRQHARIAPAANGYVLTDTSTNGVYVNGDRVNGSQLLARADVIRVGSEEFRFYADVAPVARPAAAAASAPAAAPVPAAPAAPAPAAPAFKEPPTEPKPMAPAAAAAPAPAAPAAPSPALPVLAVLEVTGDGALKGTRIELRGESASIGRGAHNDASLPDDSVSDSHARLERRDDGWYVMDAGSTNGTYVGGKRITGERRLDGPAELRFGGVTVAFRPAGAAKPAKGTRVLEARPTAAAAATPAPSESKKGGIPAWVWILVALVIAAGAYFVVKG